MSKVSKAVQQLPPAADMAMAQLGADLALARTRRKESLKSWAGRLGVSVPTLLRLEAGEPTVSVGVLVTALWLLGREGAFAKLATPSEDRGALDMDIRSAEALGRSRARASRLANTAKRVRADNAPSSETSATAIGMSQPTDTNLLGSITAPVPGAKTSDDSGVC